MYCFQTAKRSGLIPEKDDTDTMHSVDLALEKRFDEIAILGALGGRFDDSFANVAVLFLYFTNTEVRAFSFLKKRK